MRRTLHIPDLIGESRFVMAPHRSRFTHEGHGDKERFAFKKHRIEAAHGLGGESPFVSSCLRVKPTSKLERYHNTRRKMPGFA